jgi:hypothetical protein
MGKTADSAVANELVFEFEREELHRWGVFVYPLLAAKLQNRSTTQCNFYSFKEPLMKGV